MSNEKEYIKYLVEALANAMELIADYADGDSKIHTNFPNIKKTEAKRLIKHLRKAFLEALYLEFKLNNIKE